jgi:hypothetical protein
VTLGQSVVFTRLIFRIRVAGLGSGGLLDRVLDERYKANFKVVKQVDQIVLVANVPQSYVLLLGLLFAVLFLGCGGFVAIRLMLKWSIAAELIKQ